MTLDQSVPSYLESVRSGLLSRRVEEAVSRLGCCELCPRGCRVNRLAGEKGFCRTGEKAVISSCSAHFGEEAPLVGSGGSGTIFFTHCNLGCNFCQNWDISHEGVGRECQDEDLACLMLALQIRGCHNINLVTPSHVVPQILRAVGIAAGRGLNIPLVFNTGGYDEVETLRLLEGIVDIFMPDFKFWDPAVSEATCGAADYPGIARKAVLEMRRQVGDLVLDGNGIAQRGLLVRHLVLPSGAAGTRGVMRFLAREVSRNTYVNIMLQYHPEGAVGSYPPISGFPTRQEFEEAFRAAAEEGITRLDEGSPLRLFP